MRNEDNQKKSSVPSLSWANFENFITAWICSFALAHSIRNLTVVDLSAVFGTASLPAPQRVFLKPVNSWLFTGIALPLPSDSQLLVLRGCLTQPGFECIALWPVAHRWKALTWQAKTGQSTTPEAALLSCARTRIVLKALLPESDKARADSQLDAIIAKLFTAGKERIVHFGRRFRFTRPKDYPTIRLVDMHHALFPQNALDIDVPNTTVVDPATFQTVVGPSLRPRIQLMERVFDQVAEVSEDENNESENKELQDEEFLDDLEDPTEPLKDGTLAPGTESSLASTSGAGIRSELSGVPGRAKCTRTSKHPAVDSESGSEPIPEASPSSAESPLRKQNRQDTSSQHEKRTRAHPGPKT